MNQIEPYKSGDGGAHVLKAETLYSCTDSDLVCGRFPSDLGWRSWILQGLCFLDPEECQIPVIIFKSMLCLGEE